MYAPFRKIVSAIVLFVCYCVPVFLKGQQISIDSLYALPFDDMDCVFRTLGQNEQKQLAQSYLTKAKEEKDSYQKANGYYLNSLATTFTVSATQYADSIIMTSQNLKRYPYPGLGYLQKGIELYYINQTQKPLKNVVLHNRIVKEYENLQFLLKKDQLIRQLEQKKQRNQVILFVLISLLLAVLIILGSVFQKNRIYKKSFQTLTEEGKSSLSKTPQERIISTSKTELPEAIVNKILHKLKVFEQSDKFVRKRYTLDRLAKEIKTNSSYLSKVINTTKNINFATYLNTLRIAYAIDNLKKNKTFRSFSVEGLAEACGFHTTQSFSNAFYKQTGVKPAYFIKELNKTSKS